MTQAELFQPARTAEKIGAGAWLLPGLATDAAETLIACIEAVAAQAPFRHLMTPFGHSMSVAMTNCGRKGWYSDRSGYRYVSQDPLNGRDWPALPPPILTLARQAAGHAGYDRFDPDVCLINRYQPGARMSLHQDRDEGDFTQPIVSISLGLPAIFLWGGAARSDKPRRIPLLHGDVVVWGGADRLNYHGVAPLKDGLDARLGALRYNLTFRYCG